MKTSIETTELKHISNTSEELEVGLLSDALSDQKLIEIIKNRFEDKYITSFLLFSLGYKYEEIATMLLLSTNIVKSRIFYVQKKMQRILMDMSIEKEK